MKQLTALCALTTLWVSASTALADGDGALATSYQEVVRGGGILVDGVGTAGRTGTQGPQTQASLSFTLPTGANVRNAFVYVNTIGTVAAASLTLDVDGNAVNAPIIGTHGATCWGSTNVNRGYRGDVTDYVKNSATVVVSGFPSSTDAANDSQGVSLVVVYEVLSSGDAAVVTINDGMIATDGSANHSNTINNITIGTATTNARLVTVVGDGQLTGTTLSLNSLLVSSNAFPGASGPMFDTRDDDVFSLLSLPVTLSAVDVTSSGDCLSWMVNALSYTFPDNDGDGIDDDADDDDDNDGVLDASDPSPLDPKICGDDDADGCDDCAVGTDGFGPLPDFDTDNDGTDTDGDGICDDGDPDADNDGVDGDAGDPDDLDPDVCGDTDNDGCDDCAVGTDDFGPLPDSDPSNDGPDADNDGICDEAGNVDSDGDGIPNAQDNCPDDANPGQEDGDADGVGDVCDNCPNDANPGQEDGNNDGVGDACDAGGVGGSGAGGEGGNAGDDDDDIGEVSSCGCRVPGVAEPTNTGAWALLGLALLGLRRRRR